ncbi:phosphoglycerate kinase [Candidatus Micrarchaeota archaeon]|nr:phosphoglycerate kinase [Candidatus Micrarchaeota archaeon]
MRKILNYDVSGKTIFVRVDLNSPVENGKITASSRIYAHAKTIHELSHRGAKVVVLSHQGRDGHPDFISLEQHAKLLHDILRHDVHFVDDVIGEKAKKAIAGLKNGEVLVLDNVRFLHCETHHSHDVENELVAHLAPLADYYVIDALSVAHRNHSSVVGFSKKLPCFAGDILASEIEAVSKVRHSHDVTFIFGGSKVDDSFAVMKKWLSDRRAREVLVTGALSVLLLYAKGYSVGGSYDYLKNSGLLTHVPDAKALLEQFGGQIILPVDVGLSIDMKREECDSDKIEKGQIWDIGEKTIAAYVEKISKSSCIVMNGPAGVYELEDFSKGTKALLKAVADCDAFSLLGGGHTIAAIEKLGIDKKYFGYVSLSGKALIEYLCGKSLPGLLMLDENELHFPNVHATKAVNH